MRSCGLKRATRGSGHSSLFHPGADGDGTGTRGTWSREEDILRTLDEKEGDILRTLDEKKDRFAGCLSRISA